MVLSMERWVGKVAVVTGASSGIGAAVAEQLTNEGLKVVGLARRKERLDEIAEKLSTSKGKFYSFQTDISKEEDILKAFKWIKEKVGPISILINNAGIVRSTSLSDGDSKLWQEVIQTNVMGLCIGTREAVRDMKANNIDGHIIHINSLAGHYVPNIPGAALFNLYPASKHAVTALAETLRLELNVAKFKIKITSISPGLVETEIISKEFVGHLPALKSEDIADSVVYALSTPPHVLIQEITVRPVGEAF